MWPNFVEIGRILSQVWPEGHAVIWQQWKRSVQNPPERVRKFRVANT
jgi:hypothetical protein